MDQMRQEVENKWTLTEPHVEKSEGIIYTGMNKVKGTSKKSGEQRHYLEWEATSTPHIWKGKGEKSLKPSETWRHETG